MKGRNRMLKKVRVFSVTALMLTLYIVMMSSAALAADTVYNCKINPCYSHPVTGEVEDSGGSSSQATGQGMAESALGTSGTLSAGSDGSFELTFTMSLIDYTSKQSFWVQEAGDTDWTEVTAENTATGKDSNGTTKDYRIRVPSESCIVKVSMYVDPMGRDVIFYFYPSDYTLASGSESEKDGTDSSDGKTSSDSKETSAASVNEASGEESGESGLAAASESDSVDDASGTDNSGQSSIESSDRNDEALGQASGLSLSTESEAAEALAASEGQSSSGSSHPYICLFFTIVLSGGMLILMGVIAVYYCRRNWKKWGGTYEDDDEM